MSVDLGSKVVEFTIADEFHTQVLDDRVLWPSVDGKILSPGWIKGAVDWQHRRHEYAKESIIRHVLTARVRCAMSQSGL